MDPFTYFSIWLVTTIAMAAITNRPKYETPKVGQAEVPGAAQGGPIPVVFGTRRITQANVVWWGHVTVTEIQKAVRKGGLPGLIGKKQNVTVGYHYYAGIHLVLCHGPVDAITRLWMGPRVAWSGSATASQAININQPNLYGGDDADGGVQGNLDLAFGGPAQGTNAYLAARLGTPTPNFRGVTALILNQMKLGTSAYLKPWSAEVRRMPVATAITSVGATIGADANPAHIIYEALTDTSWGGSILPADIDVASFNTAAATLAGESFGLSLVWAQTGSVESFIGEVLRHISGSLFVDPATGLFKLKLLRGDYVVGSLPALTPSNIVAVERFDRAALGELINQVSVRYQNRDGDARAVSVQDIAALELAAGVPIATESDYLGIADDTLANKVALRDLATASRPLARATIIATRAAATLGLGDAFKLTWPDAGIAEMVMRVGDISYGNPSDNTVQIQAMEDVFAQPTSAYIAPVPSNWSSPISAPTAATVRKLTEAPFHEILWQITGNDPTKIAALSASSWFALMLYARPSGDAIDAEVRVNTYGSAYGSAGRGTFNPTGTLAGAVDQAATVLVLATYSDLDTVVLGSWALVTGGAKDECVRVDAVDSVAGTVTVSRGVLDTVPQSHPSGARIWFTEPGGLMVDTEFVTGMVPGVKVLPRTGLGSLAEASAPTDNLTPTSRHSKPYAPGDVRVNNVQWPSILTGELTLSWAHRNRLAQIGGITPQSDGPIGPEAGVTYTVRYYDATTNTLLRTDTGATGSSKSWTLATEFASLGVYRTKQRIEIESVRGGVTSHQTQVRTVERAGYGMNYGNAYGGT